jgi:hypothetical protein
MIWMSNALRLVVSKGNAMNTQTQQPIEFDQDVVEQFVKDSGVLVVSQQAALKANLVRLAYAHGFEVLRIRHDHHPVVELSLYVGNQNEQRTSLRCRSMVWGLLRSAGVSVRKNKVFARYSRSVIRTAVAVDW